VPPRLYTLEEAEALLPRLAPILESIRDAQHEHSEAASEVESLQKVIGSNGHGVKADRVAKAREVMASAEARLRERLGELTELGVELKDPATGLIDFRSRHEGRVVYLCWRLGEPRIDWWHDLDAGFGGRQRLERPD
jgi:hypothetical protein